MTAISAYLAAQRMAKIAVKKYSEHAAEIEGQPTQGADEDLSLVAPH
jgi:hypothetical protein